VLRIGLAQAQGGGLHRGVFAQLALQVRRSQQHRRLVLRLVQCRQAQVVVAAVQGTLVLRGARGGNVVEMRSMVVRGAAHQLQFGALPVAFEQRQQAQHQINQQEPQGDAEHQHRQRGFRHPGAVVDQHIAGIRVQRQDQAGAGGEDQQQEQEEQDHAGEPGRFTAAQSRGRRAAAPRCG
jgi:hypothetical protein